MTFQKALTLLLIAWCAGDAFALEKGKELVVSLQTLPKLLTVKKSTHPPHTELVKVKVYTQPVDYNPCIDVSRDTVMDASTRTYLTNSGVGVVLSGGISKGLAFVSALKILDGLGVPIDGISGTSMGAVIGSLYSAGYSGEEIEYIVLNKIDWTTLFTDQANPKILSFNQQFLWGIGDGHTYPPRIYEGGLRSGHNVYSALTQELLPAMAASGNCFDELPIRFRAVATDVLESQSVSFSTGTLINAVRASLSFPAVFTPIFIDGKRYQDGGLLQNYPINELRAMGPLRVIIGLDVSDKDVQPFDAPAGDKWFSPLARRVASRSTVQAVKAVGAAVGSAITRETMRQVQSLPACTTAQLDASVLLSTGPVVDPPCLLNVTLPLKGDFTDFTGPKINRLLKEGRELISSSSIPQTFSVFRSTGYNREEKLREQFKADYKSEIERLKEFRSWLMVNTSTVVSSSVTWVQHATYGENLLHGESITFWPPSRFEIQRDSITLSTSDRIAGLKEAIHAIVAFLETGSTKHIFPEKIKHVSSAKVAIDGNRIQIKVYYSQFPDAPPLEFRTDFTERDSLRKANLILWGDQKADTAKIEDDIGNRYSTSTCISSCTRGTGDDWFYMASATDVKRERCSSRRLSPAYSGAEGPPELPRCSMWKGPSALQRQFHSAMKTAPSDKPLRQMLRENFDRYYAQGNSEYVRLEAIERDKVIIAEKTNNKQFLGTFYGDYQFDNENGHAFLFRNSMNPHGTNLLTNAGLLHLFAPPESARHFDTRITLPNPTTSNFFKSLSLNPYWDKRVVNIARPANEAVTYVHEEHGLRSAMDLFRAGYVAFGITFDYHKIPFLRSESFRDLSPLLLEGDFSPLQRQFYRGGRLVLRYADDKTIEESPHNLNWSLGLGYFNMLDQTHFEAQGDFEWKGQERKNFIGCFLSGVFPLHWECDDLDTEWSLKAYAGGAFFGHIPFYEKYSVGGYYPIMENAFWKPKRADFIGTGLNEQWGPQVLVGEGRYSLPYLYSDQLRTFNKNFKAQVDAVLNVAKIYPDRAMVGIGLSGSLFLTGISSFQPRVNISGGPRWLNRGHSAGAFAASVDLLF